MNVTEQMELLCQYYFEESAQVFRNAKIGDGLFGMGDDPKKNPCHQRFYDNMEQLMKECSAGNMTSKQTGEVVFALLTAEDRHKDQNETVKWMLMATQGLSLPMIPRMEAAEAASLLKWYSGYYSFLERFPMQRKVIAALKKAARR